MGGRHADPSESVCQGTKVCLVLRLEEGRWGGEGGPASRVVHLVEHQLPRDARLRAEQLARAPLEGGDVLLHNLVEEHRGQLGVQEGAELKGDLGRKPQERCLTQHREPRGGCW